MSTGGWLGWAQGPPASWLPWILTDCMSMDRYYASLCLSFLICEMISFLQGAQQKVSHRVNAP